MATKIVTKNSSTAGAAPTATDLVQGELAVNVADKRLFTEDNGGSIVELGTNPYNFTANHDGSAKLATTATGINVTGTASATSVTSAQHLTAGSAYSLLFGDGGERISGNNSSSLLNFFTGATERMRIDSIGRVGIGTSSPTTRLDVRGGVNSAHATFTGQASRGLVISTSNTLSNDDAVVYNAQTASSGKHIFQTAGTERMRIDSSGNVGIGTSSPVSELDVAGITPTLTIKDTQNKSWTSSDTTLGELAFRISDASGIGAHNVAFVRAVNDITSSSTPSGALSFGVAPNNSNASEAMRIDSSGNVGIGTSDLPSSEAKLTLSGTGASTAMYFGAYTDYNYIRSIRAANNVHHMTFGYKYSGGSDVERMRIDSSGNLLLNTANSPTTTKAIISSDYSATGTTNTGLTITGRQGGNWWNNGIHALGASGLVFSTGTSGTNGADATNERMRIDASGRVGIGTSSPSEALHISSGGLLIDSNIPDAPANGTSGFIADYVSNATRFWSRGDATTRGSYEFKMLENDGGNQIDAMVIDASGQVQIGAPAISQSQTSALLSVRRAGPSIEFGHNNAAGYGSTIGAHASNGKPYVAFSAEPATTTINAFRTRGLKGTVIAGGASGEMTFNRVPLATADNQVPVESMRIDASGNLLVGQTAQNYNVVGASIGSDGLIRSATTGQVTAFNRKGSDGVISVFYKDGTTVGSIGTSATANFHITSKQTGHGGIEFGTANIMPMLDGVLNDNATDLGNASYRWDDIYATNGTIQTSDRNEKQDIAELSEAEQRVAVACKGLLRKFRWKDSVAEKGDEARIHFGIIAQDLQAAFAAEGLDAGDYAMFISTTWTDEETNKEKTRMGVRYSELLAFIIAAL